MKGYKTFIFFAAVSLLGVITMIDADHLKNILLPLVCHANLEQLTALASGSVSDVPAPCVDKVLKLTGAIMVGIGVMGKILRFITTSPIFKPDAPQ